jgi:hypothetical protein
MLLYNYCVAANLIALGDLKSLSLNDKSQELCLGVSLLLLTCYIDYLNIVYIMHYIHINSLCLNQHLMHLLYILHYVLFYTFQRTSVLSAGDLIFNCSIFGASLAVNTCQNALVKYGLLTDAIFFKISQRSLMMSSS